jgi:hypothetical protein
MYALVGLYITDFAASQTPYPISLCVLPTSLLAAPEEHRQFMQMLLQHNF